MSDHEHHDAEDEDEFVETVPEPPRAKLSEDLVKQLMEDDADPELASAVEALLRG